MVGIMDAFGRPMTDIAAIVPARPFLSSRDNRLYDIAYAVAEDSPCSNKHGAIIVHSGNIEVAATNRWHPYPHSTASGKFTLHAEQRAILRWGTATKGATLASARAHFNRNSRPCAMCWALMIEAGIKWCIFHDGNQTVKERVK